MEVGNGKCRCGERKGKDVVNGVHQFPFAEVDKICAFSCVVDSCFMNASECQEGMLCMKDIKMDGRKTVEFNSYASFS